MASDYIKLTNSDCKTIRVAYDSIEVILPQTNYTTQGASYEIAGSTIYMANGTRFWVREQPEFIDHMVEAFYEEHMIDFDSEDEEE